MTGQIGTTAAGWVAVCPVCGKRQYPSRKNARRARRRIPADGRGLLSAYQCPAGRGWHLGRVRPGDRDRRHSCEIEETTR